MENDDVPDWAIERALSEVNRVSLSPLASAWTLQDVKTSPGGARWAASVILAARYIAQHEKPPVDPDLMLAREIAAVICEANGANITAVRYREGRFDDASQMAVIVKLLKERK